MKTVDERIVFLCLDQLSPVAAEKLAKIDYYKGMVVFTHAKGGLMYEASVGGQKFSFKPKE